jgi:NAD(P) transhydrogenase subunit alpha
MAAVPGTIFYEECKLMPITIAVLKESAPGERRVALDPSVVARLSKLQGINFRLQNGAGAEAGFPNELYPEATITDSIADTVKGADIVVKVQPPTADEVNALDAGCMLISQIQAHNHVEAAQALCDQQITTMAMELVPRITRAQAMDVLSSQATVSGYKAALMAAELSPRLFPMLTTAAGTIRPSKVVVIGAGVAGLQAIATARRLGAQVEAYDIRPAAKEQIESLGAKMIDTGVNAEGAGGYARELTDAEKQQQADALAKHMTVADAVISTAAIPGRPAPKIVTTAMVEGMKPGAVLIDLAAETGGNCELTVPGETVKHGDKVIYGPLNVPSLAPVHASEMYAKNILNLLNLMVKDGELAVDYDDEVIAGCLLTREGALVHAQVLSIMGDKAPKANSAPMAAKAAPAAAPEAEAEELEKPQFLNEPDGEPDDLKQINGIGPKLEVVLHDLGIYHFAQIAALSDEDAERIDGYLKFKGRIQREGWIEQAKNIVEGK